jgi:hypothetical protein
MPPAFLVNRESRARKSSSGHRSMDSAPRPLCFHSSSTASLLLAVALISISLAVVSGCGPHSDRRAVSGKVTLNRVPLDEGTIRFASVGAEKISASGTNIENGQYQIPQEKGLRPGTYRVEISAPDNSKPPVSYSAPGQPRAPATARERIPAEYNDNSKKTIEVTADGNNHFEFDIASREAK